ncbi:MAG: transglutaminaseTgpA domain-containing protein [Acidimicrobiales bacterium]
MRRVPQLLVVAAFVIVAVLGFHGSLDGWGFLLPACTGTIVALIALLVAKHYRLYVGESVALSVVLFGVGGVIVTGGSYPDFFAGLIGGWADLLSSAPPATLTHELAVLPYAVAWSAMLIGGELSRRAAQPMLPIIGPITAMVATALVSVETPRLSLFQGVVMAVGALMLGLMHLWTVIEPLGGEDSSGTVSRRLSAVGLTALLAVAAPLLGPRLPFAGANERFDLRDHRERPWDPLAEPSPLVTVKASLKEGRSDQPVFSVTSDVPLTRWTTAVLASYNGTVWSVADEGPGAPAEFEPVDRRFPSDPDDPVVEGEAVAYRIEFAEPTLWVPVAGRVIEAASASELRFNRATGTVAAPLRVDAGSSVELQSVPRTEPAPLDLMSAEAPPADEGATLDLVPPQLRNLAGDLFEGIAPGPSRAVALADRFTQQGFYDHGDDIRPGHNLARLDEFLADPDRVVGYTEQYAAAAGLLAAVGEVPARVVVGYRIPADRYVDGTAVVVADDIAAWIEIRTVEFGWVPIDVTPDRAREPQDESLGVTITDVAIPNPPPPPPPPPDDQVVARPETDEDELDEEPAADDQSGFIASIPTAAVVATTVVSVPMTLLTLFGSIVVAAKVRRTKRRRRGTARQQVVGAWQEMLDGYAEAGIRTTASITPDEVVASLLVTEPSAAAAAEDLRALANHLDRANFHPRSPDDHTADDAWQRCATVLGSLRQTRTRRQRLAMRTDPRPLLRPRPNRR